MRDRSVHGRCGFTASLARRIPSWAGRRCCSAQLRTVGTAAVSSQDRFFFLNCLYLVYEGDDLGQCLAHYIMGSGFIAYGVIMAIMLLVGEAWVRRSGRSPEWWDSWVIMLWGIGVSAWVLRLSLNSTAYFQ
jgi:hypothetical protein